MLVDCFVVVDRDRGGDCGGLFSVALDGYWNGSFFGGLSRVLRGGIRVVRGGIYRAAGREFDRRATVASSCELGHVGRLGGVAYCAVFRASVFGGAGSEPMIRIRVDRVAED